jgi:hypothetical protein
MEKRTARLRRRFSSLRTDCAERLSVWDELREYLSPHKGRYLVSTAPDKTSGGTKKHQKIYNGTPTFALRTLAAGIQGGLTSPSRNWFSLILRERSLMEATGVRGWLQAVRDAMRDAFNRSNFYGASYRGYEELGAFGTAACLIEADDETIIRFRPLTIGEYLLTTDGRGRPNAIYRRLDMTVEQMADEFGIENCSIKVQHMHRAEQLDELVPVINVIQERKKGERRPGSDLTADMAWESLWFEETDTEGKFLRESGYRSRPFTAPRWAVDGQDAWGTGPGHDALGDTKQLMALEADKLSAIKLHYKPPMIAPPLLKRSGGGTIVPGGVNFLDTANAEGFRPAYQIVPQTTEIAEEIRAVEARIQRAFYTDLFLAVINSERQQTAYEVQQRLVEKLTVLGPVVQQLESEFLDCVIARTFEILWDKRLIPEPPLEIQGADWTIEYEGLLAQAAKATDMSSLQTLLQFAAGFAQLQAASGELPTVGDKVDADQAIDELAHMIAIPAGVIRDDLAVAQIRAQRAARQQAMAQQQQIAQMAETAKTASQASYDGGRRNVLDEMQQQFQPGMGGLAAAA